MIAEYTPNRASIPLPRARGRVGWGPPGYGARETAAVVFGGADPEQYLAEALDRLGAGLAIGVGDARPLRLRQLPFEIAALLGQFEQPLAPVARARTLDDKALPHQL